MQSPAVLACGHPAAVAVAAGRAGPAERGYGAEPSQAPRISWGKCPVESVPDSMQCGTIEVPLDYADPAKGTTTVAVAVARMPATEPDRRIGSLLLNFGGPGGPGIEDLANGPGLLPDLGERYDIVAFDPRGVAHSDPVTCGREAPVFPDPDAGTAEQLAALRAEARRCAQASGPVFPYMGTNNVARDMDVLREALSDRKLNFLGFSYGTRLGAAYATLFPQRTGRMVLDGVENPNDSLEDQSLATARARQRALDNFLT